MTNRSRWEPPLPDTVPYEEAAGPVVKALRARSLTEESSGCVTDRARRKPHAIRRLKRKYKENNMNLAALSIHILGLLFIEDSR